MVVLEDVRSREHLGRSSCAVQNADASRNSFEELKAPDSVTLSSEDAGKLGLPEIPGFKWKVEAVLADGEGSAAFRAERSLESLKNLGVGSSVTFSTQVEGNPSVGVPILGTIPLSSSASMNGHIKGGATLTFEVIANPSREEGSSLHRITVNLRGELGADISLGAQGPGVPNAEKVREGLDKVSSLGKVFGGKFSELAERISSFLSAPAIKASVGADAIKEGTAVVTVNPEFDDFRSKLTSILPEQGEKSEVSNTIQRWWNKLEAVKSDGCLTLIERSSRSADGSVTAHVPGRSNDIQIVQAQDTTGEVTQRGAAGPLRTMWRERLRKFLGEVRDTRVDATRKGEQESCALVSFSYKGRKESDILVASRFSRRFGITCDKLGDTEAKSYKLPKRTLRGFLSGKERVEIDIQLHIGSEQFSSIKKNAEKDCPRIAYLDESDKLHGYNPTYLPLRTFQKLSELVSGNDKSAQAIAAKEILDNFGDFRGRLRFLISGGQDAQRYRNITGRDLSEDIKRLLQADDFQKRFDRLNEDDCGCSEGLRKVLRDFAGSIELCPFTQVAAIARLSQDASNQNTDSAVNLPRESLAHFRLKVAGSVDNITIGEKITPPAEQTPD